MLLKIKRRPRVTAILAVISVLLLTACSNELSPANEAVWNACSNKSIQTITAAPDDVKPIPSRDWRVRKSPNPANTKALSMTIDTTGFSLKVNRPDLTVCAIKIVTVDASGDVRTTHTDYYTATKYDFSYRAPSGQKLVFAGVLAMPKLGPAKTTAA